MSAGAPAIPAPGPFPGSHAPPIGQLRVARRPNRPPRSLSDWPHRGRRRRAGVLRWRNNNLGNKPIWGSAWRLIWDIVRAVNDSQRSVHGRRLSRA